MKAFVLALLCAGCLELDGFRGDWRGTPLNSPSVLTGLPADTPVLLKLDSVTRNRISGFVSVGGGDLTPLRPMAQVAADTLGELSLPDDPLRSYFSAVALPDGDVLAILSLYDGRVDLRLIRADTLYAVVPLTR